MDIKDRTNIEELFGKIKKNPTFFVKHSKHLIPRYWHLSSLQEGNTKTYTLYWKSIIIGKVLVNDQKETKTANLDESGIEYFLKTTSKQAA